jgi:sugar (pentulose or hexulose) kinase
MLFLSIDFGTSSVKMSVMDQHLDIKQTAKVDYPYIILPGEKYEINPEELFKGLYAAANQLDPDLRKQVEIVCYDTFSPSPVFIKKDGSLSYPNIITHMDRRSRQQTQYIIDHFGKDEYLNITGFYPFAGGAGFMTVCWFMQNAYDYLDKTYRIGHLPTYIHHELTGEWVVDLVNASMLGLYETTKQSAWSKQIIDAFQLKPDWFGEIFNPGTLCGNLLPDQAARLGLKSGIPVAVGTNDMAAAQVGAGNKEAGRIMNTAGSSDMVSILTDKPIVNPNYYLRNAAMPGLWQIYATTAGGFAIDWFYSQFCLDMNKDYFYHEFIENSLNEWKEDGEVVFDPYLTGDRQSLDKKTGAWRGLTLAATREEMLAAMLKSMNRVLNGTIREASQFVELNDTIKLTGGMSTQKYIDLKSREIPGFNFEVVDNCSILGNVELVKMYL